MDQEEDENIIEEPEQRVQFDNSAWKKKRGGGYTRKTNAPVMNGGKEPTCVVLLSGLVPSKDEPWDDMVYKIGGIIADNFDKNFTNVTHVVADRVKRTAKFLAAVNRGFHIVPEDWLIDCEKEKTVLDAEN